MPLERKKKTHCKIVLVMVVVGNVGTQNELMIVRCIIYKKKYSNCSDKEGASNKKFHFKGGLRSTIIGCLDQAIFL